MAAEDSKREGDRWLFGFLPVVDEISISKETLDGIEMSVPLVISLIGVGGY